MALLDAHRTGYWYFEDLSIVFKDTLHLNFTVARPNKSNNKKKEMEKLGILQSAVNY